MKKITKLIFCFVCIFTNVAKSNSNCSLNLNAKLSQEVAYYSSGSRTVIRYLQRENLFNFELCESFDNNIRITELYTKFNEKECRLLNSQWIPIIGLEDFTALFVQAIQGEVAQAEQTERTVNSFMQYTSPIIDVLVQAPLVFPLIYFLRQYPRASPTHIGNNVGKRIVGKMARHSAWAVLLYTTYQMVQNFSFQSNTTQGGGDKRSLHLESFLIEFGRKDKTFGMGMLYTEANKLIYLLESALSTALQAVEKKAHMLCEIS